MLVMHKLEAEMTLDISVVLVVLHMAPRVKTYQMARLQMTSHPSFIV